MSSFRKNVRKNLTNMAKENVFFRDLIKEIHTNPNSSYQLCYTKDEIISGNFR